MKETVSAIFVNDIQIVGKESEIEENNIVEKEYIWNPQKDYFNRQKSSLSTAFQ